MRTATTISSSGKYHHPRPRYAWLLLSCLLIASLLIQGCGPIGELLSTSGPTATATITPTATQPPATATPTITPTPEPTATPIPAARIQGAAQALFNGDWDTAEEQYQAALDNSTDHEVQAEALLGLGRAFTGNGDFDRALDSYHELVNTFNDAPETADAYFLMARIYDDLTLYTDAADAYHNYLIRRRGYIDSYVYEWQGDSYYNAGNYTLALNDYQAALTASRLGDLIPMQTKVARTAAITGDTATALVMYQDIFNRAEDDSTKAEMDYLLGSAYMNSGQADLGVAAYQDAILSYPSSYSAYQSLLELVNNGYDVDELSRGLVDYYAGQYGVAVDAFNRYLEASPLDPATAYYYKGQSLAALGDTSSAIDMWDLVIANYPASQIWDNAYEQKAYYQWSVLEDYPNAAQTLLDFVANAPWHMRAGEFLYDAGRIYERSGELEKAALTWERVPTEYPNDPWGFKAIFLAGVARYREGTYAPAGITFRKAAEFATTISERTQANFWIAKTLQALGQDTEARAEWETTANLDPTGYYSERARDILAGITPFTPPGEFDFGVDMQAERQEAETWMRSTFTYPEGTNFSGLGALAEDERTIRGNELWRLGLYAQARDEFEDLRISYENDPQVTFQLAGFFREIGLYRSSILAARRVLALANIDDAATFNAPTYFNHLRFAPYYSDLVFPASQDSGIHPMMLFSIMRQESFFESFAFSAAGANGLMQFMPATGQDRANMLGWPDNYSQQDLLRPIVSITFGADYLADLESYLDGDVYAALAAYNGGPGNASAWKDLSNGDPDLFLEIVRFDETHKYITTIYEVFSIYRRLYARSQ